MEPLPGRAGARLRPGLPKRFGPKAATHPSVGEPCAACHEPFAEGDFTTLVPLGPGPDPDARADARADVPYNAVAVEVHYVCATGIEV
jgi:hypothetical protein